MSFLYPRTIKITRPAAQGGAGVRAGYAADLKATETLVQEGIRASIQLRREGQKNTTGLPADGNAPYWDVFIQRRIALLGLVKSRDVITDDLGLRYQVIADYWDSLGYHIRCMRLEA